MSGVVFAGLINIGIAIHKRDLFDGIASVVIFLEIGPLFVYSTRRKKDASWPALAPNLPPPS
jgi:hypothetical protein